MIEGMDMQKKSSTIKLILVLALVLLGINHSIQAQAEENGYLKVSYMYVGQGDGALLESDGRYMLIDAGPEEAGEGVTAYLRERGVTKLDYVISTHSHHDHVGGLLNVLRNFPVDQIVMTYTFDLDGTYQQFLSMIDEKQIPIINPVVGKSFMLGSAKVTIMGPDYSGYTQPNDKSVVVKVEEGNNSFLFTGDVETLAEQEMLYNNKYKENFSLKADVLKVAHHGALSSTSEEFLQAVNPSISVISCGLNNAANFPRKTVLARLKYTNIYRTDLLGTITMTSNGQEITVDKTPYRYAKAVRGTQEHLNLFDVHAVGSAGGITLTPLSNLEEYERTYNRPLSISFMADYGISSEDEVEYTLVNIGEVFTAATANWKKLDDPKIVLKGNFMGCVYVKFRNKLGNTVIRKTNGIIIDTIAPTNCTVSSNVSGIRLLGVNESNVRTTWTKSKVSLDFDADFGISKERNTQYMVIKNTASYQSNGNWRVGDRVTLGKGFKGRVYVKYTDWAGNVTIRKTNGIVVK